jgi:hypothetical protein
MNVLGDLKLEAARVSRASLVATFAASLVFSSISTGMAADDVLPEEVRAAAQRLLGGDDEETRYATLEPFTRELAIAGTVAEMFDASLAEAGVPAAAMLEAREALVTSLDLSRDVRAGDRFYVRYEQTFTAEGVPIGVGRVLWAEVRTRAKSTVSIHRFRTHDKTDRFWRRMASGRRRPRCACRSRSSPSRRPSMRADPSTSRRHSAQSASPCHWATPSSRLTGRRDANGRRQTSPRRWAHHWG